MPAEAVVVGNGSWGRVGGVAWRTFVELEGIDGLAIGSEIDALFVFVALVDEVNHVEPGSDVDDASVGGLPHGLAVDEELSAGGFDGKLNLGFSLRLGGRAQRREQENHNS